MLAILHFLLVLAPVAVVAADPPIILRDLARPRWVGTAANTTFLFADEKYTKIAKTQFSIFTTENEMKWETIEPFPNQFNFTAADKIVRLAREVGAKMRGHTFMWANQLPPWVNSTLSAVQLDKALHHHIDKVMKYYKGKVYGWDVINEMISDTPDPSIPGGIFKQNIWSQKFGEEAMAKALFYARKADPTAKLYVNDYRIEGINAKSNALYDVVKGFKRDGVPIDAVGFQAHLGLGGVPTDMQANLQRFADLDLDVAITELDINQRGPGNETSREQQAKDYHQVVSACVAVKRCVSVTIWGISDEHSWLPNGAVLPWDGNKEPKPAFFAMADAFKGV